MGSSGTNISKSEALAEGERHRQRLRRGETCDEVLEATRVGRKPKACGVSHSGGRETGRRNDRSSTSWEPRKGERESLTGVVRKQLKSRRFRPNREARDPKVDGFDGEGTRVGYGGLLPELSSRTTRRGNRHPLKKAAVLAYRTRAG